MSNAKSLKIAVFLGGISSERDVSLVTGYNIARGLQELGHQVDAFDVAFGVFPFDFNVEPEKIKVHSLPPDASDMAMLTTNIFSVVEYVKKEHYDLVFNALHGGYGENGQLQTILDLYDIPYTGSQALSSALAMDKILTKIIAEKYNIPTADWMEVQDSEAKAIEFYRKYKKIVVKPATEGSTIGLSIVDAEKNVKDAILLARKHSRKVMIEKYIPGRELTVSILGNEALPIIEIRPHSGFYDYESKYQGGKTDYICPAELPEQLAKDIQNEALRMYQALGCRHYSRVDFRLHEDGEHFYLLEVNTLPGMTPTSLVPKAARAVGMTFTDILQHIIEQVMKGE